MNLSPKEVKILIHATCAELGSLATNPPARFSQFPTMRLLDKMKFKANRLGELIEMLRKLEEDDNE